MSAERSDLRRSALSGSMDHTEEPRRVLLMGVSLRILASLLAERGLEIVGDAMTEHAALELLAERVPDVAVLDLHQNRGDRATRAIFEHSPAVQIVVLTSVEPVQRVVDALLAGACGHLPKESPALRLVRAVQRAAAGEAFISSAAAGELLARLRSHPRAWHPYPPSRRELQIVRLIATGHELPEIAREVVLSERLVGRHLFNLLRKLQLEARVADAVTATHHVPIAGYSRPEVDY
jgi:DNA-binding NarL/FixJ family response regulator